MTRVNKRRLFVVGGVLLVVFILLLLSLREVVREVIVIPLSYLFWVIGLLVESTSQLFFWLVVLFFALVTAYRSIRPKKQPKEAFYRPLTNEEPSSVVGRGRVGYWLTRVNTLRLGSYYQGGFNEAISRLLVELLAYRHHLTTRQVEQALEMGHMNVPPEIAEFVRKNAGQQSLVRPDIFTWLFNSIREWFLLRFKIGPERSTNDNVLDPAVRRVITYMEEELEVSYDQSGN